MCKMPKYALTDDCATKQLEDNIIYVGHYTTEQSVRGIKTLVLIGTSTAVCSRCCGLI